MNPETDKFEKLAMAEEFLEEEKPLNRAMRRALKNALVNYFGLMARKPQSIGQYLLWAN